MIDDLGDEALDALPDQSRKCSPMGSIVSNFVRLEFLIQVKVVENTKVVQKARYRCVRRIDSIIAPTSRATVKIVASLRGTNIR